MEDNLQVWQRLNDVSTELLDLLESTVAPTCEPELDDRFPGPVPALGLEQHIPGLCEGTGGSPLLQRLHDVYAELWQYHAKRLQQEFERQWSTSTRMDLLQLPDKMRSLEALQTVYHRGFITAVQRSKREVERLANASMKQEGCTASFTDAASELLRAAFERNPRPSIGDRKHLAAACRLSMSQVNQWFTNRRCRAKRLERLGKAPSSMRKARVARKVSSTSSASSSGSPGSDTSVDLRSDNGGEWQHATPARNTSWAASSPSDSMMADQYLAGMRTPSPPLLQQPIYPPYTPNNLLNEQQPFFSAPLPASLNIQPPPFPQTSLVQPELSTQYFQQMQLPLPTLSDLDNSLLSNTDIDAGIGDDFWKNIMQAAGLSDQQESLNDPVDQLKGITIPPAMMDWSHVFGDMSRFSMPEQQLQ